VATSLGFTPHSWLQLAASRGAGGHRNSVLPFLGQPQTTVALSAQAAEDVGRGILEELLELVESAPADEGETLAARVDAEFARISPEDLSELQMMIGKDGGASNKAKAVTHAIQAALDKRMAAARDAIQELIANSSGDINLGIRNCLKKQDNPLPLLQVLQLNIAQAQSEGREDKLRALLHINTVINEELEKKVSRVRGLLNKLLRMDDAGIRDNLLRHHLTPMQVAAPSEDLAGNEVDGTPQLVAALVPPDRLASAISQLISDVDRQLKAVVGEADETRFDTIERIRLIAKEARLVVGEVYGEAEMHSFGAELTPAFTALMAHKARQMPAPAPPMEQVAVPLPPTEPLLGQAPPPA